MRRPELRDVRLHSADSNGSRPSGPKAMNALQIAMRSFAEFREVHRQHVPAHRHMQPSETGGDEVHMLSSVTRKRKGVVVPDNAFWRTRQLEGASQRSPIQRVPAEDITTSIKAVDKNMNTSTAHAHDFQEATFVTTTVRDVPEFGRLQTEPRAIFDPIPVRIPKRAISEFHELACGSTAEASVLGLAIRSYVKSDRPELLYVVLLEDGREIHIPCGKVELVMLTVAGTSDVKTHNDSMTESGGLLGHASSLQLLDAEDYALDATAALKKHRSDSDSKYWPTLSDLADLSSELGRLISTSKNISLLHFNWSLNPISSPDKGFRLVHSDHAVRCQADRNSQFTSPANVSESLNASNGSRSKCWSTFSDLFGSAFAGLPARTESATSGDSLAVSASGRRPPRPHHPHGTGHDMLPTPNQCVTPPSHVGRRTRAEETMNLMQASTSPPTAPAPRVYRRRNVSANASGQRGREGLRMEESARQGMPTAPDLHEANLSSACSPTPGRRRRPAASNPARSARAAAAAEAAQFNALFSDDQWTTEHNTFASNETRFLGPTPGPNLSYRRMPSKQSLFGRFWTESTLDTICQETNRYASEVDPRTHLPVGGPRWWAICPTELRAFFGISLMMGIKRLPNHRAYWKRRFPFMYCQTIATTMSQSRYEDITRCLHIAEDTLLDEGGDNTGTDKLAKLGWLLKEISNRFRQYWHLNQEVTVDECMVGYKGKYCPIRQYIPKKPTKWGIKVWCLADAHTYYVYDFSVYTGAAERVVLPGSVQKGVKSGYDVVMLLMNGLHGRRHVVVTDNYFTSVKLTVDLSKLGTYATSTVCSNCVGLPKH